MTRAEMKKAAKEQIKGNIGKLFVVSLIVAVITIVCCFIPVIGSLASTFVLAPAFGISLCMIYLKLIKKEEVTVGNVFDGFNVTGKAAWLSILISFFTTLWSMLFVIPGIIKSYSYSLANYILADNPELTAREALNKSKEMMNGHKMDLFVLHLSFIGWYMLVGITFGIASIYVVPYMSATVANFYNSLKQA